MNRRLPALVALAVGFQAACGTTPSAPPSEPANVELAPAPPTLVTGAPIDPVAVQSSTAAPQTTSSAETPAPEPPSDPAGLPPVGTKDQTIIDGLNDATLDGAPEQGLTIALERTACYGTCPIYKVEVAANGTVHFDGNQFVRVHQKATYRIAPSKVTALADSITKAGITHLSRGTKQCSSATDNPSAAITFKRHGKTIKTDHDYGDSCAPAELTDIERQIDDALKTKVLIQCPGEKYGCRH